MLVCLFEAIKLALVHMGRYNRSLAVRGLGCYMRLVARNGLLSVFTSQVFCTGATASSMWRTCWT